MTKRTNHLHAGPVVLSLGLLAVMAFAIIVGVSQVNQNQDVRSRAAELNSDSATSTNCTLQAVKPNRYWNNPSQVNFVANWSCSTHVQRKITSWDLWGTHDGIAYTKDNDCQLHPSDCNWYFDYGASFEGQRTLFKGTHTYCAWSEIWWLDNNNNPHHLGPTRSAVCTSLTY